MREGKLRDHEHDFWTGTRYIKVLLTSHDPTRNEGTVGWSYLTNHQASVRSLMNEIFQNCRACRNLSFSPRRFSAGWRKEKTKRKSFISGSLVISRGFNEKDISVTGPNGHSIRSGHNIILYSRYDAIGSCERQTDWAFCERFYHDNGLSCVSLPPHRYHFLERRFFNTGSWQTPYSSCQVKWMTLKTLRQNTISITFKAPVIVNYTEKAGQNIRERGKDQRPRASSELV